MSLVDPRILTPLLVRVRRLVVTTSMTLGAGGIVAGCFPVMVSDELVGTPTGGEVLDAPLASFDDGFAYEDVDRPPEWIPPADACAISIFRESIEVDGRISQMQGPFGPLVWAGGAIGPKLSIALSFAGPQKESALILELPLPVGEDETSLFRSSELSSADAAQILAHHAPVSTAPDMDGAAAVQRDDFVVYEQSTPPGAFMVATSPFAFAAQTKLCGSCFDAAITTEAIAQRLDAFTLSFVAVDVPVGNGPVESGNVLSGALNYLAPKTQCPGDAP